MNRYLIVSVNSLQHVVKDAISEAGKSERIHFAGSFADCWAWIQYQEYSALDAQIAAAGKRK